MIDLNTVVWNKEYIDTMTEYLIPSLLTPGNLMELSTVTTINYNIYSTKYDFEYLTKSDIYEQLTRYCTVIHHNATPDQLYHNFLRSLANSVANKSIYRILAPDVMVNSNNFIFGYYKLQKGYKAVVQPTGGLRIDRAKLDNIEILDSTTYDLESLFFETIHSETSRHFIDSSQFFDKPVQEITQDDTSIRISSHFYQPQFIDHTHINLSCDNVEMNIIRQDADPNDIYFIKDSSESIELSITEETGEAISSRSYNKHSVNVYVNQRYKDNMSGVTNECYRRGYVVNNSCGVLA